MEGVQVDSQVIRLGEPFGHVTVRADTGSFKGFGGNVFGLEEDEARAIRETVSRGGLQAGFVTLETAFWNTTAKPRLWIGATAEVAVATSRTTSHAEKGDGCQNRRTIGGRDQ
jgi:hypothetical protein